MLIWGGTIGGDPFLANNGAIYDPAIDSWTIITTNGGPTARRQHCAVWTGKQMLIWGGADTLGFPDDAGSYDPVLNNWSTLNSAYAPRARVEHTAVWTGNEMIVWGGGNNDELFN